MKKIYIFLVISLAISIFAAFFIYNVFRECDCNEYEDYEKAIVVIEKIENYRKRFGNLPNLLVDVGEKDTMESRIFYDKIDSENYEVWFNYWFFESCTYHSDTKTWNP